MRFYSTVNLGINEIFTIKLSVVTCVLISKGIVVLFKSDLLASKEKTKERKLVKSIYIFRRLIDKKIKTTDFGSEWNAIKIRKL